MRDFAVVFLGTPEFAVPSLEMLVAEGYRIAGVVTQPDRPVGRGLHVEPPPVKQVAQEGGLHIFQPESLRDPHVQGLLASLQPDLIVVAAYGRIIPEPVLSLPPFGCVNVHPSLLPKYRGASPVTAAILNGDAVTGVTIMLLDRGLDSGPILSQEQVEVAHRDTTGTLTQRLAKIGARLLQRTLPRWLNKEVQPQSQDHGQATMTRKVEKEDGRLDWGRPAQELERCVRAYNPWPGAFTRWQGKLLKVWEAEVLEHPLKELPGVVGAVDGGKVGVVTGAGVLGLVRVQLEGRAVLSGVEFVRGARGFVGSRLPS